MYQFKDKITDSPDEPSLRVGNRIPLFNRGVNLAYVNGPELVSEDTVELFDYSKQVPENTVMIEEFRGDFYASQGRLLTNNVGAALVPVENTLVTSYYKHLPDGQWIPMYYKYTARFKHYEKNPSLSTENVPESSYRVYQGHNIVITANDTPTDKNYIVCLEHLEADPDYLYKVHVFSEFTSSAASWFTLEYSKWDANKSIAVHNYEEVYNSEPMFTKTDKESVLAATDGSKLFALDKILTEDGYRIYAAEDVDQLSRTPVIIRWRVKDSQNKYSTWKTDTLLRKESLYKLEDYISNNDMLYADADYTDRDGTVVYFDESSVAKKILCPTASSLFTTSTGPYTVEYELWNSGTDSWETHYAGDITVQIDSAGRVLGHTIINTGDKVESPGLLKKNYPNTACDMTIEAWLDPPDVTITPMVKTNVAKSSQGSTATSNLDTGQFTQSSNVTGVIGGTNPFWFTDMGLTTGVFYARSATQTSPPMTQTVVTVSLAQAKALHRIEIVMGERGVIKKLEVRKSNLTTQTIWTEAPPQSDPPSGRHSGKYFVWENASGIADCTEVLLTVEPTKWYVRSYWKSWFLWWHWDEVREYQSGFDIFEINAYNHYNPPDIENNWYRRQTVGLSLTKTTPLSFNMKDLLTQLGMVPAEPELQDSLQNVHYQITLGDSTLAATPLLDYNENVSLIAYKQSFPNWTIPPGFKGGMIQIEAGDGDGCIQFSYGDAFNTGNAITVKAITAAETAYFSKKFSVQTDEAGKIYIIPFQSMDKDEVWCPRINNGRITREDVQDSIFYDYYIPEYGGQAFYPDQPYMLVEGEEASYVDRSTIKVRHTPLHVTCDSNGAPTNLRVYLNVNNVITNIEVLWWNMYTGDIKLNRRIVSTDKIYVDYSYACYYYIYKGWGNASTGIFYALDLNPLPGHTYVDDNGVVRDSIGLLDKSVWIYMVATFVYNYQTGQIYEFNMASIRHTIVDRTTSDSDVITAITSNPINQNLGVIILGKIDIKRPAIPTMIEVTDSRRRGGGFSDYYSSQVIKNLNPKSNAEAVWDIGSWDGLPYPSNGVIEISLPSTLLKENGGQFTQQEIREVINQHIAFGIYVFIKFV